MGRARRRRFITVDVFTETAFGGNPLAVFPDGRGLSDDAMQRIAREMNLSETTFVLPPDEAQHTRRVRIFTPTAEVPFAGHPTLGTAYVLARTGEIELSGPETRIVLEEGVGPVPVTLEVEDGVVRRTRLEAARPPELGPPPPPLPALAAALSLQPEDLLEGAAAASCGLPFLFVPLRDRAALARARLAPAAWEQSLADAWAPDLYPYTRDAAPGFDLRARMFAPAHGVSEDPATGSAAAALAGVLGALHAEPDAVLTWRIEQGVEMGRPSQIELSAVKRAGQVTDVQVGGAAVLVSEGEMEVPG